MTAGKRVRQDRETVTTERVATICAVLMTEPGRKHTTADLARRVEMTHNGVWRMLSVIARVLPVTNDSDGWYYLPRVEF
jgi:DNA-binding IclR family transcriptional regulator